MVRHVKWALGSALLLMGMSTAALAFEADVVDVKLSAPAEKVKTALTEVLTDSGYEVRWKNDTTLETDYREESGGLDSLYYCCWGVIKSRVQATVTPEGGQTTHLRLQVFAQGKRTIFESFTPVQTPVPESAENQLRLIKNKLKIVSHPYTTVSFFGMK
ncbi:MAG: hypothetical protein NNA23_13305 [Nitrospira sp.]|nr:hypothetical protein [Nitrospira sp.]MCP9463694.1 hypothetical protein [Nitrospira sp.]